MILRSYRTRLLDWIASDHWARVIVASLPFVSTSAVLPYLAIPAVPSDSLRETILYGMLRGVCSKLFLVKNVQPVSLVSPEVLRSLTFDETFVNGGEDVDFSIRAQLELYRTGGLPFPFRTTRGASLGRGPKRVFKTTILETIYTGTKLMDAYGRRT